MMIVVCGREHSRVDEGDIQGWSLLLAGPRMHFWSVTWVE